MTLLYKWLIMMFLMNIVEIICSSGGIPFSRQKRSDHESAEKDEDHGEEEEHGEEGESEGHHHTDIINSVLKNYDPSSPPNHGKDEPIAITVNVQVLSMDEISDSKMEYVIDTRMTFSWLDVRLIAHECKEEGEGCDDQFDMKRMSDKLWFPDLYILNSREAKNHEQPLKNGMVYLHGSGNVMLSKRLTLTLRCPMDLSLYPMDSQKCPIIICPYSLTESELQLKWTPNGVGLLEDFERGHSKFVLVPPVVLGHMKWRYDGPDVSGFFSCVNATFLLARLNGYHMGYSYAVTSFIVIVSWISFWLPVTAVPARVTLGVTSLLTLLTTANYVRSSLPPISYVTAIDVWVGLCTVFVFASLLLFPVSHSLMSAMPTENPMALQVESKVHPHNMKCKVCGHLKVKANSQHSTKENKKVNVDGACRIIFPILFILFNVAYWFYYIPKSRKT